MSLFIVNSVARCSRCGVNQFEAYDSDGKTLCHKCSIEATSKEEDIDRVFSINVPEQ